MVKDKSYIISIAGDSGAGKSTVANFIQLYYGYENTTLISGDDLHKWERNDVMWQLMTHLNPDANNLKIGDLQLMVLKEGSGVLRETYNHKTGLFDEPILIKPKKYIINEGLHAFYTKESQELSDLKIFIDTDDSLKFDFKIERDIIDRGYSKEKVIETIEKRKKDFEHIKKIQIEKADIIIEIGKLKDLNIICKKDIDYSLLAFIKKMYSELNEFYWMNTSLGGRMSITQSKGGNISSKINDKLMIIKSSGERLKDITFSKGYSIINYNNLKIDNINSDDELDETLNKSIENSPYKKPSMETLFHTVFKKYVFHVHPIYLNCILSLENAKDIIDDIFANDEFEYTFLKYYNPGLELSSKILHTTDIKDVVFLQNHGLIVSSDNYYKCIQIISRINTFTKDYISKNVNDFEEFNFEWEKHNNQKKFTFPDSVIIDDNEVLASQNYILHYANKLGKVKELSKDDVIYLKNLKSEKYRK